MRLTKIKTDKSDAKLICAYAQQFELKEWLGHSKHQQECLQVNRLLDQYWKQSTAIKNKMHGEEVLGNPSKRVDRSLKKTLKHLQKEIAELEAYLTELVKQEYQQELILLESIPGMGRKTATMLLVLTDGLKRFSTAGEALFNRIVAKGKSKNLALLAVCNKLLKQAFAIVKSGVKYDATYRSALKLAH
jgi:transposase